MSQEKITRADIDTHFSRSKNAMSTNDTVSFDDQQRVILVDNNQITAVGSVCSIYQTPSPNK